MQLSTLQSSLVVPTFSPPTQPLFYFDLMNTTPKPKTCYKKLPTNNSFMYSHQVVFLYLLQKIGLAFKEFLRHVLMSRLYYILLF